MSETLVPKGSKKAICFKFMPTPSGRLHVGHAWLLFVMHCLVKRARQAGHSARIVVVMDDMTGTAQGLSAEPMAQMAQGILEDLAWLQIPYDETVINNLTFLYPANLAQSPVRFLNCALMTPSALVPTQWSGLMFGTQYYLKNCVLDAAMGVTHILRGADQLPKAAVYKVFYELLGMPCPQLIYLPLLGNDAGRKISKDGTYGIEAIRDHLQRDDLFVLLTQQALKRPSDSKLTTIQQAEDELVGSDWEWVLDQPDSAGKLASFLSRLETYPKIASGQMTENALASDTS